MPIPPACRRAAWFAIPLALVACSDGPTAPRATARVTFCTDAPFVAYRNEGARWTRLSPQPGVNPLGRTFLFDATPRVAVAFAWGDRTLPYLVVEHMSAAQADLAHRCDDVGFVPPRAHSIGVVRPWNGIGEVQVAYGTYPFPVIHQGADSVFALATPDEPSDLVAVRGAWTDMLRVERMIVRRAQAYPAGSRVVLDFAADEAFGLEPHTFRFVGPFTWTLVQFRTAGGREVYVAGASVGTSGEPELPREVTVHGVPEARMAPGDLHHVRLEEHGSGARRRTVDYWTRQLRDLAIGFGPSVPVPTFRTEATQPYVRVTADVPSQPEYAAAVGLFYDQPHPLNSSISIRATREYFGDTPTVWRLEIPDFSGVPGFPVNTALKPGPFRWTLEATNRPGFFWIPAAPPVEGQLIRSSSAEGMHP